MVEAITDRITGAENVLWDLSILYSGVDDPAIQADMDRINAQADAFAARYKGRVAQLEAEEMAEAMQTAEAILDSSGRLSSYAYLLYTTDTGNPRYGALLQKLTEHSAQINQKMIFFRLEWNAADEATARRLLHGPALAKYRHYLEAERRFKPYMLSEIEEQLLIEKAVTGREAWVRLFSQLTGAMRFDYEGEQHNLEAVLSRMQDVNREVRRKAADAVTRTLRQYAMQMTYILNVIAADKAADDRRRGYPTWISARNLENKVPDAVVEALIAAVTANYELVARHYRLKRALLDLDELVDYDRYAPLPLKESVKFYHWSEARDIVLGAFHAFSPRVGQIAQRFFDERWIHAPVKIGKESGAFSHPTVPSAHPYILLNFTGTIRDVGTLAHELGHGVHQYLAGQAQGFINADTPLTTAEMASTFGEMLVFNDLMEKEPDPAARLMMLSNKLDETFNTVFRQIAMNRFENALHMTRRAEGELSTEQINALWHENLQAMFRDGLRLRDDYRLWWAYVGHFVFAPGYVYAYAFGELLVLALFNLYQARGADFVPQYVELLAAGGSDYPDKLLARVGVDLTNPEFWNEGLNTLRAMVEQEERLARQLYPAKFG